MKDKEALCVAVTIRSLNHRYLDLNIHLSRPFLPLESDIKNLVQSELHRGRVEVSVHGTIRNDTEAVVVSRPIVESLIRVLRQMKTTHGLTGDLTAADIARFPGAVEVMESGEGIQETERREVLELVREALSHLHTMREAEGERLSLVLRSHLDEIESAVLRITTLSHKSKTARREALLENLRALCAGLALDDTRLYQEVVRSVERQDISEEIQRLQSHVLMARDWIGGAGPSGKRLDFLTQELMREANTIGSKSISALLTQDVVHLKSEIEKLREQVQNVE